MVGFRLNTQRSGWKEARRRLQNATSTFKKRQLVVVRRAALLAKREIKLGLRSGAPGGEKFKELSPITKLLRRGTKPLLDTGALVGSITTTIDPRKPAAFVGVHRTAKSTDGESLVNVALVHEFGTDPYVIPVTPGVRRLFFFLFRASGGKILPLSPNTTQITHPGVPARPFVRPVIRAILPRLQKEVEGAMIELGGPI